MSRNCFGSRVNDERFALGHSKVKDQAPARCEGFLPLSCNERLEDPPLNRRVNGRADRLIWRFEDLHARDLASLRDLKFYYCDSNVAGSNG
jgi:hypothetical protein